MPTKDRRQEYVSKFTQRVLDEMIFRYQIPREESVRILKNSSYGDLLEVDIALVMHYPPTYWAKKVYEEANLLLV